MASDKITATQLLFPLSMLSLVVVVFLGFQTTLLMTDRAALSQAHMAQDKPLEQALKVKEQANVLAVGTKKLADGGNKDAQNIIAQLKKMGIEVQDQAPASAPAAPAAAPPAAPAVQP